MKRLAAALLVLPLAAFDCGGKSDPPTNPFGGTCQLHVGGAISEDEWCIVAAHDYSQDQIPQNTWGFILTAYQANGMDVGAGAGVFVAGRPTLGVPYGWSGGTTSNVTGGSASRYTGSALTNPPTAVETHSAVELAGTGSFSVTFTQIPPVGAAGAQSIGVHGSLTATLPSDTGGAPVTFSAMF